MNPGQQNSLLTSFVLMIATSLGTFLVSKGVINVDDVPGVAAGLATLIVGGIMFGVTWFKQRSLSDAAVRTAAAAAPGTVMVVTTPAIANSAAHAADDKIVSISPATPVPLKGLST